MISTFAGYKLFSKRHIPPSSEIHPSPDSLSFQFAETILRIIWHQKIKKPLPFARSPSSTSSKRTIRYYHTIYTFKISRILGQHQIMCVWGKNKLKENKENQKGNEKTHFYIKSVLRELLI